MAEEERQAEAQCQAKFEAQSVEPDYELFYYDHCVPDPYTGILD